MTVETASRPALDALITPAAYLSIDHCSEGEIFGLDFLGKDGRPLIDCLRAARRADWLIKFAVNFAGMTRFEVSDVLRSGLIRYTPNFSLLPTSFLMHKTDYRSEIEDRMEKGRSNPTYHALLNYGRMNDASTLSWLKSAETCANFVVASRSTWSYTACAAPLMCACHYCYATHLDFCHFILTCRGWS